MDQQMKVQVHDISPVKKRMEIEIPAEDVARELNDLIRRTASRAKIPGFRRGKVPASLVRQRFGREIEKEAQQNLVGRYYARAVEEQDLHPLHDPLVEDVEFRQGEAMRFRALFEIRPRIELGTYRGLAEVAAPEKVTDEDVDKALESLRESAARYVPVDPRPVERGDHVIANVSGRFPDGDGEDFKRESVLIAVGSEDTLPEITEALTGASPGDGRTVLVEGAPGRPGTGEGPKKIEYTVDLLEIKKREVPELDDDFAGDVGIKDGLEALKAKVRDDLEKAARRRARTDAREKALRKLIEAHPFDVPEVLVERQMNRQMEEIVRRMLASGMEASQVEAKWREIREGELPKARDRVRGILLLEEIARREELAVSDEEIDGRIEREAKEMGVRPEILRGRLEKEGTIQALKNQMLREKALDILLNGSRITP